jgi:hypothetical protein
LNNNRLLFRAMNIGEDKEIHDKDGESPKKSKSTRKKKK